MGLCSALSELHYPKSLKMTVVDKFKEWSLCVKLAKVFIEDDLGRISELFHNTNVELLFIQTDLPGNLATDAKYFEILEEADEVNSSDWMENVHCWANKILELAMSFILCSFAM